MRTIAKAKAPPIVRAADQQIVGWAKAFIASMRQMRARLDPELVTRAIHSPAALGELFDIIDHTPLAKRVDYSEDPAVDAYARTIAAGARSEIMAMPGLSVGRKAFLLTRLDIVSGQVVRAARTMTAHLVTEVGAQTKAAIRQVMHDAVRSGEGPSLTNIKIQEIVGLHSKQVQAVSNYRQGLQDAAQGARGRAGLQGQWTLSPKIPVRAPLDAAKINQLVDGYADRLLEYRGYNIARTETMNAAHMGQQMVWNDMIEKGWLASGSQKVWMVTDDDRLCELCAPMDGQVVEVSSDFSSTERGLGGNVQALVDSMNTETPPLHPSCRCTMVLEDVEGDMTDDIEIPE